MSRMYQHNTLPTAFESMSLYTLNTMPQSYHRSADESDSSSHHAPGGGGYTNAAPSNYFMSQPPSRSDTPFLPGRVAHPPPTSLVLAPEFDHEYAHIQQPPFHGQQPELGFGYSYGMPDGALHHAPYGSQFDHHASHPAYSSSYHPNTAVHPSELIGSGPSTAAIVGGAPPGSPLRQIEIRLRHELGLNVNTPLSLSSLADPGEKPPQTYLLLAQLAIITSPSKRLTLQELYTTLETRFAYFRNNSSKDASWRQSIRHMLSLRKEFRKVSRDITEPGKGAYWEVTDETGNKRPRIRNSRNKQQQSRSEDDEDDDYIDPNVTLQQTTSRSGRPIRSPYNSLRVETRGSPGPFPSDSSSSSFIDSPVSSPSGSGIHGRQGSLGSSYPDQRTSGRKRSDKGKGRGPANSYS